jgi:hypothetical protein
VGLKLFDLLARVQSIVTSLHVLFEARLQCFQDRTCVVQKELVDVDVCSTGLYSVFFYISSQSVLVF